MLPVLQLCRLGLRATTCVVVSVLEHDHPREREKMAGGVLHERDRRRQRCLGSDVAVDLKGSGAFQSRVMMVARRVVVRCLFSHECLAGFQTGPAV